MADIADQADNQRERLLECQIAAARRSPSAAPTTECVECGEPSMPGARYCCAECRDDGDRRERMRRIEGK